MAALEGNATLSELAQRFHVHAHQIAEWRRQLVAQAAEGFSDGTTREAPIHVKALHAKIGQQALELDFLAMVVLSVHR